MQERKQPETLRLSAVMPALTVADIEASIAWYQDILGFIVTNRMEHEGTVVGASLRAGAVELLLGQDDWQQGRDRQKGVGFRLYCVSRQKIDDLAAQIVERGGMLASEPADQPWGARDFAIEDPDGFKISISTGISG